MFEENKENFSKGNFFELIRRGFIISNKSFIPSYIIKMLSIILIFVLGILTMKIIEYLTNTGIDPRLLMVLITSIVLIYIFSNYLIVFISDNVLYHSATMALFGKTSGIPSIKHSFKNISKLLLFSLMVTILQVIITIIFSLLNNIGGPALTIGLWIYRIIFIMLSPMLYLIIPFMILEKLGAIQSIQRAFQLGMKNYLKVFAISITIGIVFYIVRYIFSLVTGNFSFEYIPFLDLIIPLSTHPLDGGVFYYLAYIIYLGLISSLFVLSSGIITALSASLMGEETSPKEAYNKIASSIQKM